MSVRLQSGDNTVSERAASTDKNQTQEVANPSGTCVIWL